MRHRRFCHNLLVALIAPVLFLKTGCDQAGSEVIKPQSFDPAYLKSQQQVLALVWDDLMPEGEEAEIARQQREFFIGLNRRLEVLQPQTLAEAGAAGGYDSIEEGSELDYMPQLGTFNVVEDLDNKKVRIPGFLVPLQSGDYQQHSEFLLVPYFGACIHLPPPPPNQIIYVTADMPVRLKQQDAPFFVEGVLKTERRDNDLGNTAYTLELDTLMFYEE